MTAAVGSLCSGYGGLDLAVEAVTGARTIWHSEIDPKAASVFAHHWPHAPNLGDLTLIDWSTVPPVDLATAGYPCQPFSLAGNRKGTEDARHLWPFIAEAVRHLRPRYVFLENVPGHRSMGFGAVHGDLAALGYDTQWVSLRASDVGACHGRERVFILASDPGGKDGSVRPGLRADEPNQVGRARPDHSGVAVAYTDGTGRQGSESARRHLVPARSATPDPESDRWDEGWPEPEGLVRGSDAAVSGDAPTPDPEHGELERERESRRRKVERVTAARSGYVDWGKYEPAIRRHERTFGRTAPHPVVNGARGGRQLSGRLTEWMQGLPDGWITAVPGIENRHALKISGNGVIPRQAATALRWLLAVERAG